MKIELLTATADFYSARGTPQRVTMQRCSAC